MNTEPFSRRQPREEIKNDISKQLDDYKKEEEEKLRLKEKRGEKQNTLLERLRVPSQEGFHSIESLQTKIHSLASDLGLFGMWEVELEKTDTVTEIDGRVIAAKIIYRDEEGIETKTWLTLEYNPEEEIGQYVTHNNGQIIDTVKFPKQFDFEWLKKGSECTKIVKSRPSFLYPDLLGVPADELWPRGNQVAIIGDPFQTIDKEGVTIVEYEYASEMMPPVLSAQVGLKDKPEADRWISNLHFEDLRALDNQHISGGNVYKYVARDIIDQYEEIATAVAEGTVTKKHHKQLAEIKERVELLIGGKWTTQDATKWLDLDTNPTVYAEKHKQELRDKYNYKECELSRYDEAWAEEQIEKERDGMNIHYEIKQASVEAIGNPEAWIPFVTRWEEYLNQLPVEYLRIRINDIDKKIEQAKHWLKILPTSTSAQRVRDGLSQLDSIFSSFMEHFEDGHPEANKIYSTDISYILDSTWGTFNMSVPGRPVPLRTKTFLNELVSRYEQLLIYADALAPELRAEQERIWNAGIPLSKEAMLSHLTDLEHRFAKQHFHQQPTKATAIHGFFPHDFDGMDPQDRIVALTSVTMHGWNEMNESEFYQDIEASLPYLKPGGKYILGPVNQYRYFGGYSNFDAEGLTRALKRLQDKGQINYRFIKGTRDEEIDCTKGGPHEEINEEGWVLYDQVLLQTEAAKSLVITKL